MNDALAPPECITTNPACRPRIFPPNMFNMQLCGGNKDACYDPLAPEDVPNTWCPVVESMEDLPPVLLDEDIHEHELTKTPWMKYHNCDVCGLGDLGKQLLMYFANKHTQ